MKDHKGLLSKSKISTALRCLGFNPLNKEMGAVVKKYKGDAVSFKQFEEIIKYFEKQKQPSREEISESVDVFDIDGEGWISRGQMKHLLCSDTGEGLTSQEFEELFETLLGNEDGMIRASDLAHLLSQGTMPALTHL